MVFQELEIDNFGRFHKDKVELTTGINLIYGENETGKTTLYYFLKGMLFGMERARGRSAGKEPYSRYEPWENPGEYGGKVRFCLDERHYRLERSFARGNKRSSLVCEDSGEKLTPDEETMCQLLNGVSKGLYESTMSVGQLKTEPGMSLAEALQNHAANYYGAGSALDIVGARKSLKDLRKENLARQKAITGELLKERREMEIRADGIEARIGKMTSDLDQKRFTLHNLSADKGGAANRAENLEEEELRLSELQQDLRESLEKTSSSCTALQEQLKDAIVENTRNHERNQLLMEAAQEQSLQKRKKGMLLLIAGGVCLLAGLILLILGKILPGILLLLPGIGLPVWGFLCLRDGDVSMEQQYPENEQQILELESELDRMAQMRDHIEDKLEEITQRQTRIHNERKNLWQAEQEGISSRGILEGEIRQLRESLEELRIERENLQEQLEEALSPGDEYRRLKEEEQAIGLADSRIAELADVKRRHFGTDFNDRVSAILSDFTDGKYTSIVIDEDLTMRLNTRDRLILAEEVSRGTMEQIYLALRIAALEIMYGEELPLILDDALTYYDDRRLAQVLRWMEKSGKQVLLFSCQSREKRMMDEKHISYHLVELKA